MATSYRARSKRQTNHTTNLGVRSSNLFGRASLRSCAIVLANAFRHIRRALTGASIGRNARAKSDRRRRLRTLPRGCPRRRSRAHPVVADALGLAAAIPCSRVDARSWRSADRRRRARARGLILALCPRGARHSRADRTDAASGRHQALPSCAQSNVSRRGRDHSRPGRFCWAIGASWAMAPWSGSRVTSSSSGTRSQSSDKCLERSIRPSAQTYRAGSRGSRLGEQVLPHSGHRPRQPIGVTCRLQRQSARIAGSRPARLRSIAPNARLIARTNGSL